MTVGGLDESGNRSAVVELTTLNPFTNPIQPCYEDLNLFPRPVSYAAGGPIGKLQLGEILQVFPKDTAHIA